MGQVLGLQGNLPEVFTEVEISFYLLRRLLGVKTQEGGKQAKVQKLTKGEILLVNIGSTSTGGKVRTIDAHCVNKTPLPFSLTDRGLHF